MLPKSRRISREAFKSVSGRGQYSHSVYFSLKVVPADEPARFAVAVSKKVSKRATDRNRIRRRVYSTLSALLSKIEPGLYVINTKQGVEKLKGEDLEKELEMLLKPFINKTIN